MTKDVKPPRTPICYSLTIHCGLAEVIDANFNTNSYSMIIEDLQNVIRELKALQDPERSEGI